MAKTACHRQSFLAVLEAERCEIWDSHRHLGTTKEKPVHKATLEDNQGMRESKNTCVYISVCVCEVGVGYRWWKAGEGREEEI